MEDAELLALYASRTERALEETRTRYGAYCHAIAMNILADRRDAEECESDAYLAAWKAIPPAKPACLRVYLGKIVRNLALDRYAANTAQKRSGEFAGVLDELEALLPGGETPENRLAYGELAAGISRFLKTQKSDCRRAFLLRYWYGASLREIGGKLDMGDSRVKSMLFRTRCALKKYLEKEGLL